MSVERKMTIARGLTRIKVITAQIDNCLQDMQKYSAGNSKTLSAGSNAKDLKANHAEVEKLMRSTMQKFSDLCTEKTKIKLAIDAANARTFVNAGGRDMTIAEALSLRSPSTGIMKHYERAISAFGYAVSTATQDVQRHNTALGKLDEATKILATADVAYFTKADDIVKFRDFTTVFKAEIDGLLNEVNAITEIIVD